MAKPGLPIPNPVCFSISTPLTLRGRIFIPNIDALKLSIIYRLIIQFADFLYVYFLPLALGTFALVQRNGIPLLRRSGKGFTWQRGQQLMVKTRFVEPSVIPPLSHYLAWL